MLDTRYEPIRLLGAGGMASVWLARDGLLARDVAIKRLLPELAAQPEMAERFTREGTAAAALSHPNVVTVFDAGVDGEGPYLVMEHVDGPSLAEQLTKGARLPSSDVARIGTGLASALAHAHERGVVHRDVKPANVLVDRDGSPRLVDFGIAQVSWAASDLTATATQLGTAAYFSPEQARGSVAGPASDVYSLGVLLYRLVTGTVPFEGTNPLSVAAAHVHDAPRAPADLAPVDERLNSLILRCLSKEPSQRPSATELEEPLAGIARLGSTDVLVGSPMGAPASPTDPTVVLRLPPTEPEPRRRLWLVGVAVVAVLAVAAAVAGVITGGRASDRLAQPGAEAAASTETSAAPQTSPPTTIAAAPATTQATTTTIATTTTTPPAGPQTIAAAIDLLVEQVDGIAQGADAHPKVLKDLRKRTDELASHWEGSHNLNQLQEDANEILDDIDSATRRGRLDEDVATELDDTLTIIVQFAASIDVAND
jgi:serine/threonine-protein kinase